MRPAEADHATTFPESATPNKKLQHHRTGGTELRPVEANHECSGTNQPYCCTARRHCRRTARTATTHLVRYANSKGCHTAASCITVLVCVMSITANIEVCQDWSYWPARLAVNNR